MAIEQVKVSALRAPQKKAPQFAPQLLALRFENAVGFRQFEADHLALHLRRKGGWTATRITSTLISVIYTG